jgi:Holliday junction resolvase-like predicted endonuclease
MNVETQMLIAMLELSSHGPVLQKTLYKHARMPEDIGRKLLKTMQSAGLVYVHENFVEIDDERRLGIAVRALKLGGDVETVSHFLQWKEFEAMAAFALENNGYAVQRNLRFKHGGRKWEIDVIGIGKPLAVCIDCKHWHHRLCTATIQKIVNEQINRVHALVGALPNPIIRIAAEPLEYFKFLPVIISLIVNESKFDQGVPIVPILQLQDFLTNLPTSTDSLLCISSRDTRFQMSHQKKIVE